MKTVKIKNTVPSKIEPTNFASIINDMPRVKTQSPQMTAQQSENFTKSKDIIDTYNAQKKLQDTYIRLKQNLEACREAKPEVSDNLKDLSAIRYFEGIEKDMLANIASIKERGEQKILYLKQKMEEETLRRQQQIERELEWQKSQLEQHEKKISGIQERLNNARERAKTKNKKTKEEIKLEKQLQQLLIDFKKTNPEKDLEYYFPNYKALLGSAPLPPSQKDPPLPPPPVETNKNTIDDEDDEEDDEEEEEKEETLEEKVARCKKAKNPWHEWIFSNVELKDKPYERYHLAIANGITPTCAEPPNPNKPVEDEVTLWNKMTPWQRFVKQNPRKTQYALYQEALGMGIDPDIPEPPNPNPPKPATHANKTVSRESLAKIVPGYN